MTGDGFELDALKIYLLKADEEVLCNTGVRLPLDIDVDVERNVDASSCV